MKKIFRNSPPEAFWLNSNMVSCKYAANLQNTQTAIEIYENHAYVWMFPCKFGECLQNTSGELLLNIEKYPRTIDIYG